MAAVLGKFVKQPNEVIDYTVDYADWFEGRADVLSTATAVAEAGITVSCTPETDGGKQQAKIVASGGADGSRYKVTVTMTTSSGIVKEVDFIIAVKEI